MNLLKAIEILSADESDRHPDTNPAVNEATKLGIEALNRCKTLSENSPLWAAKPLPGETKED